jgi:CRISPR-associated protein Csx17
MSSGVVHTLALAGCTPTPLSSYLKALGIFRLVAEQKDTGAKACWHAEQFVLITQLTREELLRFFLEDYRPTPIMAPWNGGSGFYFHEEKLKEKDPTTGKRQKTGARNQPTEATRTVDNLLLSRAQRFAPYAQLLRLGRETVTKFNFLEAPKDDEKVRFIQFIRGSYPDAYMPWLDAALVLTAESTRPSQLKSGFPPLLGTGGNDGNLDFTNNFMQRLIELFDPRTGEATCSAPAWLEQALHGRATPGLVQNAIGQFAPGQVGGTNATTGFSSDSRINPWEYVLMLEGTLLFLAAATRRLESSDHAALAYPFTVHPANGGSGGMSQTDAGTGKSRGEMWMPLWSKPAQLTEIRALLAEGRATVGRRAARDGLDFARAIGQLGTERGIAAFQRYGFMVRNGLSYLATPLGRLESSRTLSTALIDDLERGGFLECLRWEARDKDAPAGLKRAVTQLENALFALTGPGGGRHAVQRALILLGGVMQALAASRKGQSAVIVLPRLSAAWVLQADDDSAEYRLAVALASLADLRAYLAPVAEDKGRWQWAPDSRLCVWGKGDLTRNLVRVVERRVIEAQREEVEPFRAYDRLGARLADIQAFLSGHTDDGRIAALLQGLIWTDLPDELPRVQGAAAIVPAVPAIYAILKPFFTLPTLLAYLGRLPEGAALPFLPELPRLLAAGQVRKAQHLAWHRARVAGLGWPGGDTPDPASLHGPRLLAAMSVPVEPLALVHLLPRAEDLQPEDV